MTREWVLAIRIAKALNATKVIAPVRVRLNWSVNFPNHKNITELTSVAAE